MRKKIIIIALTLLVIVIFKNISNDKRPIDDIRITTGETQIVQKDEKAIKADVQEILDKNPNMYTNLEDAFNDNVFEDENELVEIAQYENDYLVRRLYYCPDHESIKTIISLDVIKDGNEYSQVVFYGEVIANMYENSSYGYSCISNIEEGIWTNYFNMTPFYSDTKVNYIGVWNNKEELNDVVIDGNIIDEIYEITYNDGSKYYMWNCQLSDARNRLLSIEGDVTPRKIGDKFNIRSL